MDFEVLIIGTDANAYYMARCYHEKYHKKAVLLGKSALPFTELSDILTVVYNDKIWEESEFLKAVTEQKKSFLNVPVLLISSNETYAGFIAKNRDRLSADGFLFNYPTIDLMDTLMYKEKFYKTYADSCIDLPKTVYYDCAAPSPLPEDFTFPVVLKPSNVILYNHLDFKGKNKIYKIATRQELEETVKRITNGGYNDCLIIQDFIPGDDSCLFDAVAYCDKNKKVRMLSFAQIGLQEHSRSMVGNAAVLINGYNQFGGTQAATEKLKRFLEDIEYQGFAEFDLKYDARDKKFKVLEINARQGRSSYYISPLGYNPVQLLADDLLYDRQSEYRLLEEKLLLSFVPKGIIKKYIPNTAYRKEALRLWRQAHVNPLRYEKDRSLKRRLYLFKRSLRYYRDYKNSYWKVD